jgi:hypothetical protein
MFVYILVGIFFLYALYKERQALGCRNIPNGVDCDNRNGKVVRGTTPNSRDTPEELFDKLKLLSESHQEFVAWRISFMISVISTIIIFFVCFKRLPTEVELISCIFVFFSLVYFSFNFYGYHVWRYVSQNISDSTEYLKACFRNDNSTKR